VTAALLLGVDGGGSGCRARLAGLDGRLLGEGRAGPANLTTGFDAAMAAVDAAWRAAFANAGLPAESAGRTHAAIGLAGAAALGGGARVAALDFPFASVAVRSDSEIACIGAHGGEGGGLLVVGTGSQAVLVDPGGVTRFGGWGFALSDGGSGAVLGRAAARRALLGHEGVEPPSGFTVAVMDRFGADPTKMLEWALAARPADFATLAPVVFEHAAAGDPVAGPLREAAVADVAALLDRLVRAGATRIALSGGLAEIYRPLLPARFEGLVRAPLGDALAGALAIAKAAADAASDGEPRTGATR
jgi:glucosamine kinase